jgi:hypothetical protein
VDDGVMPVRRTLPRSLSPRAKEPQVTQSQHDALEIDKARKIRDRSIGTPQLELAQKYLEAVVAKMKARHA